MVNAVAGAVVGNLVGKAMGGGKTQPAKEYQTIPGTPLQPYTYRTSIGTSTGAPEGDYGFTSNTRLLGNLPQLQNLGFGSAAPFYQQLTSGLMQQPVGFEETYSPTSLGFDYTTPAETFKGQYLPPELTAMYQDAGTFSGRYDPSAEASRIFEQESALLDPKFQQQATDLQARLFGSGRLGAKINVAEAGGQVNPETYALQRAQQQTLAELGASATQRAQAAAQQQFGVDLSTYNAQQQAAQQRFAAQQAMDAAAAQRAKEIFGSQQDIYTLNQKAAEVARQADIARFGQQIAGTQEGRAAETARLGALSDIYGLNYSAQQDYLQNLLTGGQTLFGLGQSVYGMERQLAQDALAREIARSNALKQGTQAIDLVETPQSVFAGQLANTVGTAVSDYFNPPSTGLSDPYYTFNYGSNFGANAPMATVNTGTGMFSSGGGYYNELGNYGSFAPNAFTFGG